MSVDTDLAAVVEASAEQTAATEALTSEVSDKMNVIEQQLNDKKSEVDLHVENTKKNIPFFRLSKNQSLIGTTGSVPDFWLSGVDATYTLVQTVQSAVTWGDRTDEEKSLLLALGRDADITHYFNTDFNIWRVDWTSKLNSVVVAYQQVNGQNTITSAAMTRLLSGQISSHWAQGASSQWSLTGEVSNAVNLNYKNIHPVRVSDTGSMLFALPAAIAGDYPLELGQWGIFPYVGDNQYD